MACREMRATVEAADIRRPSRERTLDIAREMLQYFLPVAMQYAQSTGDTRPLNMFSQAMNASLEEPLAPTFGQWAPPPPSPEQAEQQKLLQQMEMARQQAELAIKQIEAKSKGADLEIKGTESQGKAADAQGKMFDAKGKEVDLAIKMQEAAAAGDGQGEAMKHLADIQQREDVHQQAMRHTGEKHQQQMMQDMLSWLQDS